MSQLHAWSAIATLVLFALTAIVGLLVATGHGSAVAVELMRRGAVAVAIVAVLAGAAVLVAGSRPGELLHLLYGAALLMVLPVASSFAAAAPRAARAGVLAAAALVGLLLLWRLFTTG